MNRVIFITLLITLAASCSGGGNSITKNEAGLEENRENIVYASDIKLKSGVIKIDVSAYDSGGRFYIETLDLKRNINEPVSKPVYKTPEKLVEVKNIKKTENGYVGEYILTSENTAHRLWYFSPDSIWSKPYLLNKPVLNWAFFQKDKIYLYGKNLRFLVGGEYRIGFRNNKDIQLKEGNARVDEKGYLIEIDVENKNYEDERLYIKNSFEDKVTNSISITYKKLEENSGTGFIPQFYGCLPNDTLDDAACIVSAIRDAKTTGKGAYVKIPAGEWLISSSNSFDSSNRIFGIILPEGINIIGDGDRSIIKLAREAYIPGGALFTLQGNQKVENINIIDEYSYSPNSEPMSVLRLGKLPWFEGKDDDPEVIKNISIINNVVSGGYFTITNSGKSLENLTLEGNVFKAYRTSVSLTEMYKNSLRANNNGLVQISSNTFLPGEYLGEPDDTGRPTQGAMGIEVGVSNKISIIRNTFDGKDSNGWRAGAFFHLSGNQENIYVIENTFTCMGAKSGDGEAIAFDFNHNELAYANQQDILEYGHDYFTTNLPHKLSNREDVIGYWAVVTSGRGVGQARRVIEYSEKDKIKYNVYPDWIVKPSDSKIVITRAFHTAVLSNNIIDNRKCERDNIQGGSIGMVATILDLDIVGNKMYDSDGITLAAIYNGADIPWANVLYGANISDNFIQGKHNPNSRYGGIQLLAGSERNVAGPILFNDINVTSNTVLNSQGIYNCAICMYFSWWEPNNNYTSSLILFQGNEIEQANIGIYSRDEKFSSNVYYKNIFNSVLSEIEDQSGILY